MDDTVLESHTENPAHVHMMFLDDGKVDNFISSFIFYLY